MNREKITEYCLSIGLDTVGFIPLRVFEELRPFYQERKEKKLENEFEEENIEKRIRPMHYMEDGKTMISIAFPYFDGKKEGNNGFSIYTKRMDYHRVVKKYLEQVCDYIKTLGKKAECFVDSNTLPERYIAYLAGIGFIGRNNMIITKKYGSYVFLGEIITDLEIECKDKRSFKEIKEHKECKDCTRCIQECPTKSINKMKVNPNICLSYITQKKEISDKEMNLLKGNVFGCDFCQLKCPYNEHAAITPIEEFQILDYMNDKAEVFAGMDNKFFKERISSTSCGWRGKNVIRRNAIIHLYEKKVDIEKFQGDSEYINKYIRRMLDGDKQAEERHDS